MNNSKSQFFSTKEVIAKWLKYHNVENYTINDDLSVDADDDICMALQNLKLIPIKFKNVSGTFHCGENQLINLIGSPETVGGDFWCRNNNLTNLIGAPKTVGRNFYCGYNNLTSLIGSPQIIGGDFDCDNNKLSIFESSKFVGGDFDCSSNELTTFAGAPKSVGGNFVCANSLLISLLDLINCDFKHKIYFNIDKDNFKQKELIGILEKYYKLKNKRYKLTNKQFHNIIKPQIEKEILKNKLSKSKIKIQTKKSFL